MFSYYGTGLTLIGVRSRLLLGVRDVASPSVLLASPSSPPAIMMIRSPTGGGPNYPQQQCHHEDSHTTPGRHRQEKESKRNVAVS